MDLDEKALQIVDVIKGKVGVFTEPKHFSYLPESMGWRKSVRDEYHPEEFEFNGDIPILISFFQNEKTLIGGSCTRFMYDGYPEERLIHVKIRCPSGTSYFNYSLVVNCVRHELEHYFQPSAMLEGVTIFKNLYNGLFIAPRSRMIRGSNSGRSDVEYFIHPAEVAAYVCGLRLVAKLDNSTIENTIDRFLDLIPRVSAHKDKIKKVWLDYHVKKI